MVNDSKTFLRFNELNSLNKTRNMNIKFEEINVKEQITLTI